MPTVSVIGLGRMGSALARRLIANDYQVTVWNRSPEKAQALGEAGARVALSVGEAIAASPTTITCIKSQRDTLRLLALRANALAGKTIIEVSTGDAVAAEELTAFLMARDADCLIGAINAHPAGIGEPDTALMVVGPEEIWERCSALIKLLGGSSIHLGSEPGTLAALFTALFTARQGYMFGLFYGAALCREAGIPLQTFVDQMPISLRLMQSYFRLFADSVPERRYGDPSASLATYADVFDDALATFEAHGARAELPRLMSELARRGVAEGYADKQLTAIVEVLEGDRQRLEVAER